METKFFVSEYHQVISCNADACEDCNSNKIMHTILFDEAKYLAEIYDEQECKWRYHLTSTATNKGLR